MAKYQDTRANYRAISKLLVLKLVALFALVSVLPIFLVSLSSLTLFRFPLDFYLLAQGFILMLVGIVFWYTVRQDKTDKTYRVNEDI